MTFESSRPITESAVQLSGFITTKFTDRYPKTHYKIVNGNPMTIKSELGDVAWIHTGCRPCCRNASEKPAWIET